MDSARQDRADNSLKHRFGGPASAASGSPGAPTPAVSWLRLAAVAVTVSLPLIVVPGFERPFSTPKVVLLATVVVLFALLAKFQDLLRWPDLPVAFQLALAMWLFALGLASAFGEYVSLEAFVLQLTAIGWFLLLLLLCPRSEHLTAALVFSAGAVAILAVLQYFGADPFKWLGWAASPYGSPRMRVFATLGNPNFAAAFLIAILPLTMSARNVFSRRRILFSVLLVLQGAALLATGSRAAALAITTILLWWGLLRGPKRGERLAFLVVPVALGLLIFAPARPLSTTLQGRLYVWKVALPHLVERPLVGFGLTAFAQKYEQWEIEHWSRGRASQEARKFVGPQDHAHNDYLEIFLEQGAIALAGLLALLFFPLCLAWRNRERSLSDLLTGASAGLVGLAAIALVDFPLHRPTELSTFWTLIAIIYLRAAEAREGGQRL